MKRVLALFPLFLTTACLDSGDCGAEEEIDVADLPQAVVDAIEAEWPGATLLEAEREEEDGEVEYEVELETAEGEVLEVELLEDGTIEEWESEDDGDDDDEEDEEDDDDGACGDDYEEAVDDDVGDDDD